MNKTFNLVLDLDETLVHFKILNDIGSLSLRPGLEYFLIQANKLFNIYLFTAAT